MQRQVWFAGALLIAVFAVPASGEEPKKSQDKVPLFEFNSTEGRKLISAAASIPKAEFQTRALALSNPDLPPNAESFIAKGGQLTMVLYVTVISDDPWLSREFDVADDAGAKIAQWGGDQLKRTEPVSILRPDYIKSVNWIGSSERVEGVVEFEAPKLFAGRVQFFASPIDGKWTITEFRFPARGLSTVLKEDGKWHYKVASPKGDTTKQSEAAEGTSPSKAQKRP